MQTNIKTQNWILFFPFCPCSRAIVLWFFLVLFLFFVSFLASLFNLQVIFHFFTLCVLLHLIAFINWRKKKITGKTSNRKEEKGTKTTRKRRKKNLWRRKSQLLERNPRQKGVEGKRSNMNWITPTTAQKQKAINDSNSEDYKGS